MSEKIINGIDVSECPLYDKKTGCYHTFDGKCVKVSCAVYKWLLEYKFLKQELDIKEKMLDKFMIGSGETLEKLQKENEELKEKNKELLNLCNNGGALLVTESAKTKKYEQALKEIRENIQKWINSPWFCFNCRNNMDERLTEIKSKINEVIK